MSKIDMKPQGFLLPLPATMLSCQKSGEKPNIITMSWVGVVASEPPMIAVGIRPNRFSHHIVKDSGEFVINIPSVDQVRETDYCGHVSGRKYDKFSDLGLTPEKGKSVDAPIIKECPVCIECKVRHTLELGSHELFLGEIVNIQIDSDCVDEKGRVKVDSVKPFAYTPGTREYRAGLETILGVGGFALKK